jgi:endonuclease/exonuclease/phosphatase family metal-dependent hydrolase
MCDTHLTIKASMTTTNNDLEYILQHLIQIHEKKYVFTMIKCHAKYLKQVMISTYLQELEILVKASPNNCPTIILGDFNYINKGCVTLWPHHLH